MTYEQHPPLSVSGPLPEQSAMPASMDMGAVLGGLRRRWKVILACPLVLLLITFCLLRAIPSRYQASVELLVFDQQQSSAGALTPDPMSRELDPVTVNTQIEILKSGSLLLRVAKDLKLFEDPEFQQQSRLARLTAIFGLPPDGWVVRRLRPLLDGSGGTGQSGDTAMPATGAAAAYDTRLEVAAGMLWGHITAERVPQSYVLMVTAKSRSPQTAQRLVTHLVDTYLSQKREISQRALGQLGTWLGAKLDEISTRIRQTESNIAELKAGQGIGSKGSLIEQQIADLNARLLVVHADIAEKRARLEQVTQQGGTGGAAIDIPDAVASPALNQLRVQQSLAVRQEEQLRQQLGDRHADVAAAAAQLANINKAISDETGRWLADLRSGYDIALRRQQSIEDSLQKLGATQGDSAVYGRLQELQRAAEADTKLYDTYLSRYNEIEASKALGDPAVRVISTATVPTQPTFPPRTLILVGAGVFGLGGGIALAFVIGMLNSGARIGIEAELSLGYPVIGHLPRVPPATRPRAATRDARSRMLMQVITGAPFSPLSEAMRAIRIRLRLPDPNHGPTVILVTASMPEEGASTTAMLLAVSSAGAGQRTVLVDCDMRGRTVSSAFGHQQPGVMPGLMDVLSGRDLLPAAIVRDAETGCDIIPAGSRVDSPADLFVSHGMGEIIAQLRDRYEYIVLDAPALLSAIDAAALAASADKILIVLDGSVAHDATITEALRQLRPEAHRIAGLVFNKLAPEQIKRVSLERDGIVAAAQLR